MQVNMQVRWRNKEWLLMFVSVVAAMLYQLLGICGVVPKVTEDELVQGMACVVNGLAVLGVVIDPTTQGVSDSNRAMTYTTPKGAHWYAKRGKK